MNDIYFDFNFFASRVSLKRKVDNLTLREASKVIGISASTLSRIEGKRLADLFSYYAVCNWLELSMDTFFAPANNLKKPEEEVIKIHELEEVVRGAKSIGILWISCSKLYDLLVSVRDAREKFKSLLDS